MTSPIPTPPAHDEIVRQAQELWQDRGCPEGRDLEIWLEAERQLSGGRQVEIFNARAAAETAAESEVEYHLSPALPEQEAIQAALQTPAARAPQVPHRRAPKAIPVMPETPHRKNPLSS